MDSRHNRQGSMDPYQRICESEAGKLWEKVGIRHHHGINVPLFSLHTEHSCGIGEYLDLLPMIDWCQSIGFSVIQLLPLNDTGEMNSPYSALSAFALNPLHLSLWALPHVEEEISFYDRICEMHRLCETQRVAYPIVRKKKGDFLRDYFFAVRERVCKSQEYKNFLKQEWWLKGYALFKALKREEKGRSWKEWPKEVRHPTKAVLERLFIEHEEEITYDAFLQFLCFQQLEKVRERGDEKGVMIKGDIPILIDQESADVWLYRSNFHLEFVAGSPPDPYAPEGQYWGFPYFTTGMRWRRMVFSGGKSV